METLLKSPPQVSPPALIRAQVEQAARILSPVWPLKTFIACNPLQGLEDLPFDEAVAQAAGLFQGCDTRPEAEAVNRQLIKWCLAFLDEGQATLLMPNRSLGFYAAWKGLAPFDNQLHQRNAAHQNWLSALPDKPEEAIARCLEKLAVPADHQHQFLTHALTQLPGWAGYVHWRDCWEQPVADPVNPITVLEFLAVRLVITCLLWPAAMHHLAALPVADERVADTLTKLKQDEATYQQTLLGQVLPHLNQLGATPPRPDAQLAFCIDVRSEPFRRRLEAVGNYETLGFAGFFGLPVRVHAPADGAVYDSCPVLLKPSHDIHQKPVSNRPADLVRFWRGNRASQTIKLIYNSLKYNFVTPFALVETLGAACGLLMLERTLTPTRSVRTRNALNEAIRPGLPTAPDLTGAPGNTGIGSVEQAQYAEGALRLMGLTDNFGKLVIFCGHGSTTQNNPYRSALDCGACGGNHGGTNAQLLALMLNAPFVRQTLAGQGIHIPTDTLFMAAEHNTTTDEVVLYDTPPSASLHQPLIDPLRQALASARTANSAARCETFGELKKERNPVGATERRSSDWAEARPEWGLARNAAFIVGPRRLTQTLDLEGRCFLHSYDWRADHTHSHLETILTAPMVVAQWINTQYLFSALDPVAYGSGSKITHNVAGKLGVMQGNASDLMHGLPVQSVASTDDQAYHTPQRLLTVVVAPRAALDLVIGRQPILQKLFFNQWVHLVALDPLENKAFHLTADECWQEVTG
ncbi:DUF2309 domain-containing protein [Hymenobacter antarcticus]|uniref:Probable inorganic carbon transporter subunit DabA n=1 Tax=Hymenobacter antarcticus TaxID=486270 RepID=A0ABP7Q5C2_9BACT